MCPLCITAAVLIGVASTGGLAGATRKKPGVKEADDNHATPSASRRSAAVDCAFQTDA